MSKDMVLEIGTEEIPAHYMPGALTQMAELAQRSFQEAHISYGTVKTLGTPRRLVLYVTDVAEWQDDVSTVRKGPSVKIAYDQDGKPTSAAIGFARGQGIEVDKLVVEDGYIFAKVLHKGKETALLLGDICKQVVTGLSFPRSMRWGDGEFRFVRPLRWLVALFGDEVIPFEVARVVSGNMSRGHRFLGTGDFLIPSAKAYEETVRNNFVLVDPEERKQRIVAGLEEMAKQQGGMVLMDEDLLEEVVYLVEYPTVLCGTFDQAYLQLPEAAVITPMKDHQRYFPLRDAAGTVMNRFLTVRNGDDFHLATVQHGNERVLRARLDDAAFFFAEDRKVPLASRIDKLKKIVFQDGLGTLYDKSLRLQQLCYYLNHKLDLGLADDVLQRAAFLAKTDLATQMVMEFTELQGVMGKEYALLDGEDEVVAEALTEQYEPRFAGDVLPTTMVGTVLSLADKVDTIVGMFSLGHVSTGSQDPFALRRQTIGVLHMLLTSGWNINCHEIFAVVLELLGVEADKAAAVQATLHDYFQLRFKNMLQEKGYDYRILECVSDADTLNVVDIEKRAAALTKVDIMQQETLLQAYTRVGNMVKEESIITVDPTLFETPEEEGLYHVCQTLANALSACYAVYDYAEALRLLARGVEPIHQFLDHVLVMHDNPAVKENRLHLLTWVYQLIQPLGDIKRLS